MTWLRIMTPLALTICRRGARGEYGGRVNKISFEELLDNKVKRYRDMFKEIRDFVNNIDKYLEDEQIRREHREDNRPLHTACLVAR